MRCLGKVSRSIGLVLLLASVATNATSGRVSSAVYANGFPMELRLHWLTDSRQQPENQVPVNGVQGHRLRASSACVPPEPTGSRTSQTRIRRMTRWQNCLARSACLKAWMGQMGCCRLSRGGRTNSWLHGGQLNQSHVNIRGFSSHGAELSAYLRTMKTSQPLSA